MSNNSIIEGVKGTVIVSRCKRKFIPVIDAPLNEGGYSDWRLLIPHGYITLSEAGKRYGCGLSFQALLKIMTSDNVPSHIMHIIKNDETVDPEDGTIKNFPIYRLLCLPQTPAYQYLEREDGQGRGGVLIPMADDDGEEAEKEEKKKGKKRKDKKKPLNPIPITSLTALTLSPSPSLMNSPLGWQCRTSSMTSGNALSTLTTSRTLCSKTTGAVVSCTVLTCGRRGNSTRLTWCGVMSGCRTSCDQR